MSIPTSKIVNVTVSSSPTFPKRKGFGLLNIIGSSLKLPSGNRIRFYSDMDGVAADFSTTDQEFLAATVFFSQSPRATSLAISRRFAAATPGELLASVNYQKTIATWAAITTGAFSVTIDSVLRQVSLMDFTGVTTFNGIAAIIQTRMQVALAGSICVFSGTRFILRSPTTGTASNVSYTGVPASGTDIGSLIGSRAVDRGVVTPGFALETITASLSAIQDENQSWYGFMLADTLTDQNVLDAAAWAEARVKVFGFTTRNSNILDQAVTNDLASTLKTSLYSRTFSTWDSDDPYQIASAFARAFTVNFNAQNSTITLKFKQLPGTTPVDITESQRLALVAKNVNYYTTFGDSIMLAEGVMANGTFFDERHGLDWLQNAVETNVFGYLFTRTMKVPQTDRGVAALMQRCEMVGVDAVNNGLLAPGRWNGMDLGEVKSGDFLPKGFHVHAQPVALQNQSDREARKAPPIQMILKGAGAIHFADINVFFER